MDRFEACLPHILLHEGGFSDDPVDTGGATMQGIVISVYTSWTGLPYSTPEEIQAAKAALKAIDPAVRDDIYRRQYWDAIGAASLPVGVDLAVFDYGVNSGITRGAKALQKCLGCSADGHIGTITLSKTYETDPIRLIHEICEERRRFLRQIKTFYHFGKGWLARVDDIENAAIAMVHAEIHSEPTLAAANADPNIPAPLKMPRIALPAFALAALSPADAPTATDAKRSAKAMEPPPPNSMAASTTGWSAIVAAFGAVASLVQSVNGIGGELVKGAGTAKSLALGAALPTALSSPFVWIGLAGFGAAVYIWTERRRRMIVH